MKKYEFESLETDFGVGYSLFGGVKASTSGHREIIERRALNGWRYVGYIPTMQMAEGRIAEIDLVFERDDD